MQRIIVSLVIILISTSSYGENKGIYPLITHLDQSDLLFRQLTDDISSYYRNSKQNKELRPLQIYRITIPSDSTIFSIAARFNLPYETITTLNRINRPQVIKKGTTLLIPNTPGIFIMLKPESDMEYMLRSWRSIENAIKFTIEGEKNNTFYFLTGKKFHKVERTFFLGLMFRFPIPKGIISSYFGKRINPITGKEHFHNGIDIAAPEGTEILAARAGTVFSTGFDPVFGNSITLLHEDNYKTFYGHIKKIFVQLNQQVQSGMIIGTVGTTGMSTGPHLHFSITSNGQAKDPILMLSGKK